MNFGSSFTFSHALCRKPCSRITDGLRAKDVGDPDFQQFQLQHQTYVEALREAGLQVDVLSADDQYPDSVFIEDAALCLAGAAIVLRPGASSRFGEAASLRPELEKRFQTVIDLSGPGYVDGGDILVTDTEVLVGLSARTDRDGFTELAGIVESLGYSARQIQTPPDILHFKTDCGLLDSETIFSTRQLAASGCFSGYSVIEAPEDETPAANLIRVNDRVIISEGYPKTSELLRHEGYHVVALPTSEAAKVDGGLSCESLRYKI